MQKGDSQKDSQKFHISLTSSKINISTKENFMKSAAFYG